MEVPLDLFLLSLGVGALGAATALFSWWVWIALKKDYPAEIRNGVVYIIPRRRRG